MKGRYKIRDTQEKRQSSLERRRVAVVLRSVAVRSLHRDSLVVVVVCWMDGWTEVKGMKDGESYYCDESTDAGTVW